MTAKQRLIDYVLSTQADSGVRVRRVYAPTADVAMLVHELGCEAVFVRAPDSRVGLALNVEAGCEVSFARYEDGRIGVAVHVATPRSYREVQVYPIH